MASPTLIPFVAEHLMALVNRDTLRQEDWRHAVDKERLGPAFTATVDDKIIGCAGVLIPVEGLGMAWMVLSHDIVRYRVWLTRTVRRVLADIRRAHRLHRIEANVLDGVAVNHEWIAALGFTSERAGRARSYTPDRRDVVRYESVED